MKIGISKKITLLYILLAIIFVTAFGFYSMKHQKDTILGEFDERVKVLLSFLRVSTKYSLLIGDERAIASIGEGVLQQNDVIFCEIRNIEGKTLYKGGSKKEKYFREYTYPIITNISAESTNEELILGFRKKEPKEIGRIYLVLSTSNLMKKLNKMKKTMGVLAIFGIISTSILITVFFKFTLGKPVNYLTRGIERISGGDLKYKVSIKSNDEFGELAASFNKMAKDLSTTLVSKEYVDNILRSMVNSLIVTDAEGTIKTVNSATLDLLGYKREEIIGQSACMLFERNTEEGKERGNLENENSVFKKKILKKLIENEIASNFETNYLTKDGKMIPVILSGSVMKDKEGKLVNIVCIANDISDRKKAELKIKASLKEKEVLLQEIHHRVKNNMQIISSLLRLQSNYTKDKKILDMYKISQNRIRSMVLIHEKLYKSKDLAQINFAKYIQDLAFHLSHSYSVNQDIVNIKTELEDIFLNINMAIPCGLIINELVSNSLKHAFPNGKTWGNGKGSKPEIFISLRSNKNEYITLIIHDNGVGLPKNLDLQKIESLGLGLVSDLVKQIDGSIELYRKEGTKFKITFRTSKSCFS
ncbi:MAG: histidine kinase dimerization/phosphoacceptor domain -containing protein [Acidobacteriota bacterium]|nr:histidine kinase dimerization/phosphoacceptor domain -containing protein [Acidobacteriota bacterium]